MANLNCRNFSQINRLPIKFPKDLNWLNENRFSQCVNGNIINDHLNDSGVGI